MAENQRVIAVKLDDYEVFEQLKLMNLHLSRIQTSLEDVVSLLSRSQISPSG